MVTSYKCSTCDQIHDELPFSYGSPAPAMWFEIPEQEREKRVQLSSDQCIIDDRYFFIIGRLEIPVTDTDELFAWLVWVSLKEENFSRAYDLWETAGRETEPPYFGWLQTVLPCYPETTLNLATNVHTRPVGERSFVELEPTNHLLAVEQRNGISLARVQEIAEICLHC